ncbi:hypothetical protein N9E91_01625 [Alphaproteobacteria bacterium]|nr:hypothetical protein [Alphaproteobacteria bacterium]
MTSVRQSITAQSITALYEEAEQHAGDGPPMLALVHSAPNSDSLTSLEIGQDPEFEPISITQRLETLHDLAEKEVATEILPTEPPTPSAMDTPSDLNMGDIHELVRQAWEDDAALGNQVKPAVETLPESDSEPNIEIAMEEIAAAVEDSTPNSDSQTSDQKILDQSLLDQSISRQNISNDNLAGRKTESSNDLANDPAPANDTVNDTGDDTGNHKVNDTLIGDVSEDVTSNFRDYINATIRSELRLALADSLSKDLNGIIGDIIKDVVSDTVTQILDGPVAKKSTEKKPAAKKATAKKPASKRTTSKKSAAKKIVSKKRN